MTAAILSKRLVYAAAALAALTALATAQVTLPTHTVRHCGTDGDCDGSYCMNYLPHQIPYQCHDLVETQCAQPTTCQNGGRPVQVGCGSDADCPMGTYCKNFFPYVAPYTCLGDVAPACACECVMGWTGASCETWAGCAASGTPNTQADAAWTSEMFQYAGEWNTLLTSLVHGLQIHPAAGTFTSNCTYDADLNLASPKAQSFWQSFASEAFGVGLDFVGSVIRGLPGANTATFASLVQAPVNEFASYVQNNVAVSSGALLGTEGTINAGGGLGGGVQIYDCKGNLVVDFGLGMGWGLTVTEAGQVVTSGAGGGGGLTIIVNGVTVVNLGGGGGGGNPYSNGQWSPSFGATNDTDEIQSMTVTDALQAVWSTSCFPLQITAGGGAGGGVSISGPNAGNYGAGYGWQYGSAQSNGATVGQPIVSEIVEFCNAKCGSDEANYNGCFCPCFQEGALKEQLTWAASIQCQ